MDRSVAVVLVGLTLLSIAFTPASSAAAADQRMSTPAGFDRTVFDIEIYANGSARWTFEYSKPLTNASEREQFEAFAAEFRKNESDLYRRFVERAQVLTATGTNDTGRNMTATAFDRDAYVGSLGNRGVITLSFRWTNFGVVEGDRVVVGDVFEGGLYVAPEQQLRFEHGPGLAFASVDPDPSRLSNETLAASESVTWLGEFQFSDNRPRLELVPESAFRTPTPTPAPQPTTQTPTATPAAGREPASMSPETMIVGLLVVGLGLGGAVAWRTGALSGRGGSAATTEDSSSGGASASQQPADGAATAAPDSEPAVPDEELLSDSDRVVNLLEENGGRMKQVDIVEETDWSKSKVSMLLSDMEDDGEISKLRVGRENIISLAGHEPDAAGSPFDDE
ncbi:MAG: helix-turn-helix transcriptional regulator [Haloarculaceae archaeon]